MSRAIEKCLVTGFTVLILAAAVFRPLHAADEKQGKDALAFPEVDLREGSTPQYGAFVIDPFDRQQVAYFCLDGNLEDGYKTMHVWVPGHPRYDRPKTFVSSKEQAFGPVKFESETVDKKAELSWTIRWAKHSRAAGSRTHFDYKTGKRTTSTYKAGTWNTFGFSVDYVRRARGTHHGGLDIVISEALKLSGDRTKLPAGIAPWEGVRFTVSREVLSLTDKEGALHFKGGLRYSHRGVTIRSLPDDTELTLTINPYMEPPVHDAKPDPLRFFEEGYEVTLACGWYHHSISFKCDGLEPSSTGGGPGALPPAVD